MAWVEIGGFALFMAVANFLGGHDVIAFVLLGVSFVCCFAEINTG